uniref:Uncharacterized protein n=1 Tax=Cannabis sativa TaxID=3483 RepID=A0A803PJ76_CANSA
MDATSDVTRAVLRCIIQAFWFYIYNSKLSNILPQVSNQLLVRIQCSHILLQGLNFSQMQPLIPIIGGTVSEWWF